CIVDIEILTNEDYDSFVKFVREIEGVKSIKSFKSIDPPNDRNCVVSIPKFTDSEKRVIIHLLENPRMQVTEISKVTGFSPKKTKRLLGDLTSDNRLWFSVRARITRKGYIAFVLKVEMDDHQTRIEVNNWIKENIPEYWHTFPAENALFLHFQVDDSIKTRQISEKVKSHPLVVSTQSFIRHPYKKRQRMGERMLRELIGGTTSHIG
ncbi:MAG: winged helix-turn-helix transcriptional regulator, partial [Candidatus Thorarchaeota archaeon]